MRLEAKYLTRIVMASMLSSCDPSTAINAGVQQAVNAIDNAVNQLHIESSSWQATLVNLESGLDQDAKDLIDNDIQNLLNQTITRAGIEARCEGNFLNDTVAEDLLALKAKLLNTTPPVRHPEFCQVDPALISVLPETPTSSLQFAGYNFDPQHPFDVKVHHADGSETAFPQTSVNLPTTYITTISLAGANMTTSDALYIYWNGSLFHSIGVFTPQMGVCQTRTVDPTRINVDPSSDINSIGPYYPPQVNNGADKDFDGHGPSITLRATLIQTPKLVQFQVFMDAKETRKDFTEVQGTSPLTTIFEAEAGWEIDSIASPTVDTPPEYIDNHFGTTRSPYLLHRGGGALVNTYSVVGDQSGDDVGRAGVTVELNKPVIVERQAIGCLSPKSLSRAIAAGTFGPTITAALKAKLAPSEALVRDALTKRNSH